MRKSKIIVLCLMVICVLCFAIVAVYFLLLKDNAAQPVNEETEAAVLNVAGLAKNGHPDEQTLSALFQTRIVTRQLNLDRGVLVPIGQTGGEQQRCADLPPTRDPAQVRRRCVLVDIYLVRDTDQHIQQIILPVYGKGAKSMMYALVALSTDGRTVNDLIYYQQNETPLLGARVEDPQWRSQWAGKKIRDERGRPALKVVQDSAGQHDAYTVDGISGATLTSTGVEKSMNFWMGEQGYGNFLRHLQNDSAILTQ
ncbi:NADH:ubiquinone reductase (Na(+)-transporting) subunit C [Klebsiella sp. I138]|uniref:NADH:ubiquinone reductase (Na(+)-transporting) subunit C n=1 Tax=Klebsiella sp. I138 TaxID=2755385 RepID=UPI003DA7E15B